MKRYVISYSLKNGLGNPSVDLYLTGCDKLVKCEDCHNWEIQEESKEEYNIEEIKEELKVAIEQSQVFNSKIYLTVLGGEPLAKYNKDITEQVADFVKREFPEVILVLYTWREIDEIDNFDYAVIGGYDKELYVENVLPSSTNQYIYDFRNKKRVASIKLKGAIL